MAVANVGDIRNVALIGHGASGKTSLGEAMLHETKVTTRLGSVPDKTSILDFTDEAKDKGCSLDTSLCFLAHKGKHINIIDTPGAVDFCGPAISALAGVETAILVVSAAAGIQVNTRKMFDRAVEYGLGIMIVINKIDVENVDLAEVLGHIKELFGAACVPVTLPAGGGKKIIDVLEAKEGESDLGSVEEAHTAAVEAIVAFDDALMEKYFAGEVSLEEVDRVAHLAVASRAIIPVFFTNAKGEVGTRELLDKIVELCPSPLEGKQRVMTLEGQELPVVPDSNGPFVGQVFKAAGDPKSNIRYSVIRVLSGKLAQDTPLHTTMDRKGLRPGHVHRIQGPEHPEVNAGIAGDIVSLAKLDLAIGEVLYSQKGGPIAMPKRPRPMYALALEPKNRGDEEKMATALRRFTEEDPCLEIERVASTHELVLRGIGELHLRTVLDRMHKIFKVDVNTHPPRIPYVETITTKVLNTEYTHKKQTGGAGQYGKVVINLEPNERGKGYEFIDKIFGGSISQPYRAGVDKGIKGQMVEGVLAGCPIVDIKVELIDGKEHPVDSKDIAFQLAGRGAFKDAFMRAKPVLLEPIVDLEVTVPADTVGDVQGELASRRGRPQGQDSLPGNMAAIRASIPLSEVSDYHSRLSSITGGQGSYSMQFSHYEVVPPNVQQTIVAGAKKHHAEE